MAEQNVEVNIYPDPLAYVVIGITKMAREDNKMKRLDEAMRILEAMEELTFIPKK